MTFVINIVLSITFVTTIKRKRKNMTTKQLEQAAELLPRGAKGEIATALGCLPSKLSMAFKGFVRDKTFMDRLTHEVSIRLPQGQPA